MEPEIRAPSIFHEGIRMKFIFLCYSIISLNFNLLFLYLTLLYLW